MTSKIGVLAGLLLVTTCAAADAGEGVSRTIRFTAIPDHNASELKQKYDPVAAYLAENLGVNVEYVPAADYQASVGMFKNGDVQLAWFGGLTGVRARVTCVRPRRLVLCGQGTCARQLLSARLSLSGSMRACLVTSNKSAQARILSSPPTTQTWPPAAKVRKISA